MEMTLNTNANNNVTIEERVGMERLCTVKLMAAKGHLDLHDEAQLKLYCGNISKLDLERGTPRFVTVYKRHTFKYRGDWHYIGRMSPRIEHGTHDKGGMSATFLKRDLRNLLFQDNIDLDQVCAVQRIGCCIFVHFGIPECNWAAVMRYALSSTELRAALSEELGVSVSEVKQAFNQTMFGGDSHLCKRCKLLKEFKEHIETCTAILMRKPEMQVFLAYATHRMEEKKKKAGSKKDYDLMHYDIEEPDNLAGMFLAHVVFHCESVATFCMYKYITNHVQELHVNTLEYDGLKLRPGHVATGPDDGTDDGADEDPWAKISTEFLKNVICKGNRAVQEQTGMGMIEFNIKEMAIRNDYMAGFDECKDYYGPVTEIEAVQVLADTWRDIVKANVNGSMVYLRPSGTVWVDGEAGRGFELENMVRRSASFMVWEGLQSVRGCRTLREGIQVIVKAEHKDPHFEELLHTSTKGKLCYEDGVYDFATGEFRPWSQSQDVHSLVTTGRTFPANRPSEDKIREVKGKLVDSCFTLWHKDMAVDEDERETTEALVTLFLQRLARAMAGHVEDKVWMMWLGLRNSGKGVIIRQLELCFGKKYVQNIESGNLFPKDSSQDSAKLLSWLIPVQYARIAYTNEISIEKKCDGQQVKKIGSGGDSFTARQNYHDEQQVQIDFTLTMLCNERPDFTPDDCLQNCSSFRMRGEFTDQGDIEKASEHQRKRMKVADSKIKHGYCIEEDTIAAFTHLLFDHYLTEKPSLDNQAALEDMQEVTVTEKSISSIVNKYFAFDEKAELPYSDIKDPRGRSCKSTTDEHIQDLDTMWSELEEVGVKSFIKLRSEIVSKLEGVTVAGLPKESRRATHRCLKGVQFVSSIDRGEVAASFW